MLSDPSWGANGSAGSPESDPRNPDQSVERMAATFERRFGLPCPASFHEALLLPDPVEIVWKQGRMAGEFLIRNPLLSENRKLDPTVHDWVLEGKCLGEMRIVDQVTEHSGPFWTLFRVTETEVEPTLYIFDASDIWTLDIDLNHYLEMAALTRGLLFWQFLFCEPPMYGGRYEALREGLEFLRTKAPAAGLNELDRRLKERRPAKI